MRKEEEYGITLKKRLRIRKKVIAVMLLNQQIEMVLKSQ